MKTIVIFLNADRAEFLKSKADGFTVELIPDSSGLYEVRISFNDNDLGITMLKLFHYGIQLGMNTTEKVIDIAYKPNKFKTDDIMNLHFD